MLPVGHLHLAGSWPQKRHAVGRGAGPWSGRSRRASIAPPGSSSPFPCSWPPSASGDPTRSRHPAPSRSSTRRPPSSSRPSSHQLPDRSPGTEGQRTPPTGSRSQLQELRLHGRAADVLRPTSRAWAPRSWSTSSRRLRAPGRRPPRRSARSSCSPTATTSASRPGRTTTPRAPARCSSWRATSAAPRSSHPIVLVSTDGGAYGGLGAAHFAESQPYAGRIAALVNLDSIGSGGSPRIEFAGDTPRVPSPTLLATADEAIEAQAASSRAGPGRSRSSSTSPSRSASTSRRHSSRAACPR